MASKFLNLSTDTTLGGNSPSDYLVPSEKAIKTYVDNNSGGGGESANKDIDNLTVLGNARLQYAPFAINAGTVLNGENNTLTYSGATITCSACAITTADGRTFVDDSSKTYSVSNLTNGNYNIFKNYTNGNLSSSSSFVISKTEPEGETPWTQPILSANGTLGGNSFAVYTNNQNSSYPAWKAFDGSTSAESNEWVTSIITTSTSQSLELIMYNPDAIRVTNISVTNRRFNNTYASAGNVYGSNDNSSYTLLKTFTNNVATALTAWDIDLSSNTEFYKYYKIVFTGIVCAGSAHYFGIAEITLTATEGGSIPNGAMWLDTSTVPANLKEYSSNSWTTNNNLVHIGKCTVAGGSVSTIVNNQFNMNGYLELANLPDYSAKISITSGNTYIADFSGWILNGNEIVQPLYVGQSYTPASNGYYFAPMKGY